jgi:hypothetical protein
MMRSRSDTPAALNLFFEDNPPAAVADALTSGTLPSVTYNIE